MYVASLQTASIDTCCRSLLSLIAAGSARLRPHPQFMSATSLRSKPLQQIRVADPCYASLQRARRDSGLTLDYVCNVASLQTASTDTCCRSLLRLIAAGSARLRPRP